MKNATQITRAESVANMPQPQLPRQLALLLAQLCLAARYDLPVILHSRRTHDSLTKLKEL